MEKFCTSCGTPYEEGTRFCGNCGAALTEDAVAPAATVANPADTVKKLAKFILIGFAVIALVLAVLNFGGFYDVTATATWGELTQSESGPVKDLYEAEMFVVVAIGNYTNAVLMVLTAAVAILGILKEFNISSVSDKIIKSKKACKELCLTGLLGTIALGIQIFFYLLTGMNDTGSEITVSIAAPWFAWVALVLFAAIIVIDKVLINKKK